MTWRIYPVAALACLLVLTGCATGTDLLPVEPGDGLLPVIPGNPDTDLLPVEPGDGLLPVVPDNPDDDLLPITVPEVSGKECLAGTWLLDNVSWRALMARQVAGQGGTIQTPTGSVRLTLMDSGHYSIDYSAWTIRITSAEGTAVIKRSGLDSGSYAASESEVTLNETVAGSRVVVTQETSSRTIVMPPSSGNQASFAEEFSYGCVGDILSTTVPEGTFTLSRVSESS